MRVTALVRDPSRLAVTDSRLTVVRGDATRAGDLAAAMRGPDAVLSALGSGKSRKSDIASRAAVALVEAAGASGVDRVIWLSALGVGDSAAARLPCRAGRARAPAPPRPMSELPAGRGHRVSFIPDVALGVSGGASSSNMMTAHTTSGGVFALMLMLMHLAVAGGAAFGAVTAYRLLIPLPRTAGRR